LSPSRCHQTSFGQHPSSKSLVQAGYFAGRKTTAPETFPLTDLRLVRGLKNARSYTSIRPHVKKKWDNLPSAYYQIYRS